LLAIASGASLPIASKLAPTGSGIVNNMYSYSSIDLLRHGETQGGSGFFGSTDTPLTELGWTQMWRTVENNPQWDRIVASPLARCAAFAQTLAERRAIPFALDERIQEMHFGAWEGQSASELMMTDANALARFWRDPGRHTPPDAEPLASFVDRVLNAWKDIAINHQGENVLLVTHGGVIRVILCQILQHPVERLLELEVKHAALRRIHIEHAAGCVHATAAP
jgi:alpha-ribazole phosphatase